MDKNIYDGGPAFSRSAYDMHPESVGEPWDRGENGMSLRDYFAAKAMQAIASAIAASRSYLDFPSGADWPWGETAREAYRLADTMLDAREEGGAP